MLQNRKKLNVLLAFVIIMLVVSLLLPFSAAFLTSSDTIDNGNNIYVPNITFSSTDLVEYGQDSGFEDMYYITNDSATTKTVKLTINSNIPVILRISNLLEVGTLNSNFILGNSGTWYYYNAIINSSETSSNIDTITISNIFEEYDSVIGIEVFQANLTALNTMTEGDVPTAITNLFS